MSFASTIRCALSYANSVTSTIKSVTGINFISIVSVMAQETVKKFPKELYREIAFRDPKNVLKSTLGDNIEITDCETTSLVGSGENYGSTLLRVKLVYKSHGEPEKELHLVAKLSPPTERQKIMFQSSFTFRKEIYFYQDVMTIYKKLYYEQKLDRHFGEYDITPRFYGARLSLDDQNVNKFDDDAVILLENLKYQDYFMANRVEGLSLDYMKSAISTLVIFHGVGLAVTHKQWTLSKQAEKYSHPLSIPKDTDFDGEKYAVIEKVKQFPELQHLIPKIREMFRVSLENKLWHRNYDDLPWSCLIHGDLWSNNLLFHSDKPNTVDNAKLLDFQTYHRNSPLRDLVFLITSSLQPKLLRKYFHELIEYYRMKLMSLLKLVGCDIDFLVQDQFFKRLKQDARREFLHAFFMIRFITMSDDEIFENREINSHHWIRLRELLLLYDENEWFF